MKFASKPAIELLESRIAPARIIFAGVPDGSLGVNDVNYSDSDPTQDAMFIDTEIAALAGDTKIAARVGGGVIGSPDTHYLRLSKGDVLYIFNESSGIRDPFLQVKSGNIILFFQDNVNDPLGFNEVQADELMGIAVGKNASFILAGGVEGDIVANLNELGTASLADDELEMSDVTSNHNIVSMQIGGGGVGGSIIAGGNISNILANATVGSILAGTAANGKVIDFFPLLPGSGEGTLNFSVAAGKQGASIKNVTVDGLGTPGSLDPFNGILQAGGGGAGGKGGTVTLVQVTEDNDGLSIIGGSGGNGTTGKGGAGGAVNRVYISGFPDTTVETVLVRGGLGGDSTNSTGGAGGLVKDVFVGYRLFGGKPFRSDTLLTDRVQIEGGAGGDGKIGGLGGAVMNADIRVETPEGVGDEIAVIGGSGGANTVASGRAGGGGSLTNIVAANQDLAIGGAYADIYLQGGAAGAALPTSQGGAGGNVSKVSLLGWQHRVLGGNGSDGRVGGNGGSLTSIVLEQSDDILPIGAQFDAGVGGAASAGSGGRGGAINGILIQNSDLAEFLINSGNAGNGGNASGGKGGAGGMVQNVVINDIDASNGATQTAGQPLTVRTGAGGDGTKGGGAGGNLKAFFLDSTHVSAELFTGQGGNVAGTPPPGQSLAGKGGAGGSFDNVSLTTRNVVNGTLAPANLLAGAGGNGAGNNGAGGAGGEFRTVTVVAAGEGQLRAGQGGDGQVNSGAIKGGAAGKGGSIIVSQLTAGGGDGVLRAGDAGVNGAKPGAGGAIVGKSSEVRVGLFARDNLTVQAGDGSNGGAGGEIRFLGYGSAVVTLSPTPAGNITIEAGDGGDSTGKAAGLGGSIRDVSGAVSSPGLPGVIYTTSFKAGDGGSSPFKAAAGGSVQDIIVLSGGYDGAILTVQAGDAGDAQNAANGAKGGDVKNVTVSDVDLRTLFRSVAAGDGGDAQRKGGAGGNVENIFADSIDIGDRTNAPFGFDSMGGIFAGAAGRDATGGQTSPSGKVTTIVAKGIASIVAGREIIPQAAESVDNIILSGSNTLLRERNVFTTPGSFQLAFTADVTAVEGTPGTGITNEVQTLTLGILLNPTVDLVFSYGGESTDPLPGNATAAQIEAELNSLASIQNTGPGGTGTVSVAAVPQGFTVTFNAFGDQPGLITTEATEETPVLPPNSTAAAVQGALNALNTIQFETNGNGTSVLGASGSFRVTYQENGNVLPLEGVEVFNSNLTELVQGAVLTETATELVPGANGLLVTELVPGLATVPVFPETEGTANNPERQSFTLENVSTDPEVRVQFSFTSSFPTIEVVAGDTNLQERQSFDVTAMMSDPTSTFTLTYNGVSTGPIQATGTPAQIAQRVDAALETLATIAAPGGNAVTVTAGAGPDANVLTVAWNQAGARTDISVTVSSSTGLLLRTATEVELETAINAMASVKVTGPDRITGTIDLEQITPANPDAYYINFAGNGDQQLMVINAIAPEVQEIDHSVLDASPTSQFTLSLDAIYQGIESTKGGQFTREIQQIPMGGILGNANSTYRLIFGNRVSVPLPGNATPAQINTAVAQMGIGSVDSSIVGGTLQIRFSGFGDQASVFSAQATSRTAPLPGTATAADVKAALDLLPTVRGPGAIPDTVTVTTQPDGDFEVTFSTRGQRAPIVAAVLAQETQSIDVSELLDEATGSFRVTFGTESTIDLLPNATPSEVQDALNALASIQAAGNVTVSSTPGSGVYDIQFGNLGDQFDLVVQEGVDEVQDVDFAAGKPVTLSVDKLVTAVEATPGASGVPEVQVLNMGVILGSDARITITFDDGANPAETTVSLPATATAQEIQDALNALPLLADNGNLVLVQTDATQPDNTTIQITFQLDGPQTGVFTARATESTAPLAADASAAEIETALNALATVQATGQGGSGGTVSVILGDGSSFAVRFNASGDQTLIGSTQEQPLLVSTIREGVAGAVRELQAFSPTASGQPISIIYENANLIGFYADHTEIDANIFHFIHNGVLTDATVQAFVPGDQPIDGLIFAKKMNQARLSVTPEAYLVGGFFYDWNNVI